MPRIRNERSWGRWACGAIAGGYLIGLITYLNVTEAVWSPDDSWSSGKYVSGEWVYTGPPALRDGVNGWLAVIAVITLVVLAVQWWRHQDVTSGRAAERARTAMGYRFDGDGTVEGMGKPRARVLDVHYFDARHRKSVAGRGLAAMATGGLSLAASNYAGEIVLTLVTDQWATTVRAKQNGDIEKLHALALQAAAQNRAMRGER